MFSASSPIRSDRARGPTSPTRNGFDRFLKFFKIQGLTLTYETALRLFWASYFSS
jgi:hypothetical protein